MASIMVRIEVGGDGGVVGPDDDDDDNDDLDRFSVSSNYNDSMKKEGMREKRKQNL